MHFVAKAENSGQVVPITTEQVGSDVLVRMGSVLVVHFEGATPKILVYPAGAAQYSVEVEVVEPGR